ncbi:hypothetical protein [Methylobacterium sp. J-068]|uniref:hypothetical protein n=1 Tax=Methylobacterium sp. J-068 TaxID=2836649 RepID=UPI001FBA550C|nr:hypothetical protein [Methylobacterium sp. J-068]MCJ2035591.1 hypothetical protein [Methylobacterium sp. J-068]
MATTFTVKAVWESGRWVLRSVRDSLRPPVGAHAEVEDALDAIATKAESATSAVSVPALGSAVTVKPAATPIPLDPILAKGRIASAYASAMLTLNDEPSTEGLDEASAAWLNSLNASELMQIDRYGAHRVGSHMAGLRQIEGLPLTPTPAEYRSALCAAAQIMPEMRANIRDDETLKRVIEEMLDQEPERYAPAM